MWWCFVKLKANLILFCIPWPVNKLKHPRTAQWLCETPICPTLPSHMEVSSPKSLVEHCLQLQGFQRVQRFRFVTCMDQQVHYYWRTCESECSFWSIQNKSLYQCDNAIIIYLLLHFWQMLRDMKSYFTQIFHTALLPIFPFHACRAYSNGSGPWWRSPQNSWIA